MSVKLIREALGTLNPENNDHWTNEGLPRIAALGLSDDIKRKDITEAAPYFNRTTLSLAEEAPNNDEEIQEEKEEVKEDTPSLQEQRDEAHKIMIEKTKAVEKAQAELLVAQEEFDRLETSMASGANGKSTQQDIQDFIKSQHEQRMKRAQKFQHFFNEGFTEAAKSPLDASMSRKNTRGAERPARAINQSD